MKYAEWHFGLSCREKDGSTRRAHLELAAKRGNLSAKAALKTPPMPLRFAHLWDWFLDLHSARGAGMAGPGPITWPDIDAWARLTKHTPSPWEVRVIKSIDGAFFASVTAE